MTIQLKQATNTDLETLRTIGIETFTDTFGKFNTPENMQAYLKEAYAPALLQQELATAGSTFQLLYVDDQLAGYLKLNVGTAQSEARGDQALEVERIYIRSAFKRQGLGRYLIQYAIDQAKAQQKAVLWLGVWEHNTAAYAFYTAMGFHETGSHVFQLGTDSQRDLIMEKTISD